MNLQFNQLCEIYQAWQAYQKERDLFSIENNIECDTRFYTKYQLNSSYQTLKNILKKHNVSFEQIKNILDI